MQEIISNTGKTTAYKRPVFRLSADAPAISPTIVGPLIQPKSPARARKANRAVPPFGKYSLAILKEPGHITPTENPQIPQPASASTALDDNDTIR